MSCKYIFIYIFFLWQTWIWYNSSLRIFPMSFFPLLIIISCPLSTVPSIKMVKRLNTSPYTPSQCSSISLMGSQLSSAEVPVGKRYEITSTMWADRRDLTHRGHSLILIFTSFISVFSPSSSRSLSLSHSPSSSHSFSFSIFLLLSLSFFFSVCSCYYVL